VSDFAVLKRTSCFGGVQDTPRHLASSLLLLGGGSLLRALRCRAGLGAFRFGRLRLLRRSGLVGLFRLGRSLWLGDRGSGSFLLAGRLLRFGGSGLLLFFRLGRGLLRAGLRLCLLAARLLGLARGRLLLATGGRRRRQLERAGRSLALGLYEGAAGDGRLEVLLYEGRHFLGVHLVVGGDVLLDCLQ